ncbi:MAG: DUF1036 domain-containing protein [Bdellovibrionales bacterium]|jgi:uncharacterized membrane protein
MTRFHISKSSVFALAAFVFLFGIGCCPRSAYAALSFCNKTAGAIETAVGYRAEGADKADNWVSEGWWRIEPGQCARVYGQPLTQRFYFYYGRALTKVMINMPPTEWSGKYLFCTDEKAFRADGDGDCAARKFKSTGFQQVDVGAGVRDYVLDFKDALTK